MSPKPRSWFFHWSASVLLLILLAELGLSVRRKSATWDEPWHITRGYTYLRTGRLILGNDHPPLIGIISTLPLLLDRKIVLPSRESAEAFLWEANSNGPSIVARARLPIMALSVILGVIVYVWSCGLYGGWAGLLALTLLVFDPNILANGGLATNDVGVACFVALSGYTFWRYRRQRTNLWAVIAGLATGLALASKFSALFLIPALILTLIAGKNFTGPDPHIPEKHRRLLWQVALFALCATLTVWATYRFEVGAIGGTGIPVPAVSYFDGLRIQSEVVAKRGHPTFLLGSYSWKGWWYYFPVAFAVKTPLPTMLFAVVAIAVTYRRRAWRQALPLLIPIAIYVGLSVTSTLTIGYRHLLPILPFLFVFSGQTASICPRPRVVRAFALTAVLVWLVATTSLTFPDYLAYFNELAGGPQGGFRVLADSNLDWGQDLPGLRMYMDKEKIESIKLGYFGTAPPEAYGIRYDPLPGFPRHFWLPAEPPALLTNPQPGVYAISATNLQGVFFPNHDLYASFRTRKPDAIIGHSIYVYHVP